MALIACWSSSSLITDRGPATPPPDLDVDALYAEWRAAPSKSGFVSALPLADAAALCDHIYLREPPAGGCGRGNTRYPTKGRD